MAQATQAYNRSFSGSVGSGIGSLINGGGKTYYILEHKVSSQYHKAGEAQEIIVDQIEIGRDASCAVRFDESFSTVSRRHAAIVRDGQNWKLVQLSKTNTTFLNGRPVQNEWYLQNGDEIQLSVNGPKLGFLIPTGNKSTVGSIGLSRRLSLFRQQALRPYKTMMIILSVLLLLAIGGGVGYAIWANNKAEEREKQHQEEMERIEKDAQKSIQKLQDELNEERKRNDSIMHVTDSMRIKNEKDIKDMQRHYQNLSKQIQSGTPTVTTNVNKAFAEYDPYVYFVLVSKIHISLEGEEAEFENVGITGTGFLLDDGRFVTARHVAEPWMYPESASDTITIMLNMLANTPGGHVNCEIVAISPTGDVMRFNSRNANINRANDRTKYVDDGVAMTLVEGMETDWAYFQTNKRGSGLKFDNQLSRSLKAQDNLTILGYPLGLGVKSKDDIHTIYSEATVARDGLENGILLTTKTTFEHGNSGGPVFYDRNNGKGKKDLVVVGVVSAIAGRSTGVVVPISEVK